MSDTLLSKLVRTIARPVGKSERHRARLHLLDWLACVAGARGQEAAELGSAVSTRGWERATYSGNALGMEDADRSATLHPGPVIWPTAMSMPSADMDMRLDAAVRGYEAMIAIGSTLDERHNSLWDATATTGGFGAATTFGSLIGFAPVEYANALGNAGSVAGGLMHMQHGDVLTGQWHIFHAVRTGRDAALHVHYGATGPQAILEGEQGLFAAFGQAPEALCYVSDSWHIHKARCQFRFAQLHTHAATEAALGLRADGKLEGPYHLETFGRALRLGDIPSPANAREARASLQHVIAVIADGRSVELRDFTMDAVQELADLRAQVSVREDLEMTARFPARSGARLNGFEPAETSDDRTNPVSEKELIEKMHTLAKWGGLPDSEAHKAVSLALHEHDANALDTLLEDWTR